MARRTPSTDAPDTKPDTTTKPDTKPDTTTKPTTDERTEQNLLDAYAAAIDNGRANDGKPDSDHLDAVTTAYAAVPGAKRHHVAQRASKQASTDAVADPTKPDVFALVAVGLVDAAIEAVKGARATDDGPTLVDVLAPRFVAVAGLVRDLMTAADRVAPGAMVDALTTLDGVGDATARSLVDAARTLSGTPADDKAWTTGRIGGKRPTVDSEPTTSRSTVKRHPLSNLNGATVRFAYGDSGTEGTIEDGALVVGGERYSSVTAAANAASDKDDASLNGWISWRIVGGEHDGQTLHDALKVE